MNLRIKLVKEKAVKNKIQKKKTMSKTKNKYLVLSTNLIHLLDNARQGF